MEKQKRKGKEARWKEQLKRYAQSGMSREKFCEKEGISLSSFNWWKKKLETEARICADSVHNGCATL